MSEVALHRSPGVQALGQRSAKRALGARREWLVALVICAVGAVALAVPSRAIVMEDNLSADFASIVGDGTAFTGFDDANIYMAYGRNVAAGHGFVYYPGGERVEGFTSFAWMLITAAAYGLAPEAPEYFLFGVSIALVAVAWFVLLRFLAGAPVTRAHPILALAIVGAWGLSSPAYAIWMTTSLMENPLWSAVLCCGTVAFAGLASSDEAGIRWSAAALAGLTLLVRPEALWIVPVWIATSGIVTWARHGRFERAVGAILPAAAALIAVVAGLTAFRLAYFGTPLPNTYYAKLSPNRIYNLIEGLRYLRDFFVSFPLTLPILAGCTALAARFALKAPWRSAGRQSAVANAQWVVVGVSLLASTALPLLTGGDHFGGFRVVQPAWPLFALPLAYGISSAPLPAMRAILVVVVAAASFFAANPRWGEEMASFRHEVGIAARGRALGNFLNDVMSPSLPPPSIGVIAAGGVAVTYRGPIVDLMGLNNVRMGHSPGDRVGQKNHAAFSVPVFWELRPDLVVPRFVESDRTMRSTENWLVERSSYYLHDLLSTPRFRDEYRLVVFQRPGSPEYPLLVTYCRRDWLAGRAGASPSRRSW